LKACTPTIHDHGNGPPVSRRNESISIGIATVLDHVAVIVDVTRGDCDRGGHHHALARRSRHYHSLAD